MRLPWRTLAERARHDVQLAEQRLQEVRAKRREAEQHAERAMRFLAENNISPKLQAIYRGK